MALSRQHPVFSPVGCLSGVIFIFGVTVTLTVSGGAIFSPGDLTAYAARAAPLNNFNSHAEFENDCLLCHQPLRGITADQCEACHADIPTQRLTQTGAHGKMKPLTLNDCASCHSDHRGRDFDPTASALKKFDHAITGFSLTWHYTDFDKTPIDCQACHAQSTFSVDQPACLNCHGMHDPPFITQHVPAFGNECRSCHDGVDKMHNFDHTQTRFPLAGRHAEADCTACHAANVPAQDTPADCAACHAEPPMHSEIFGVACGDCHPPTAWTPARLDERPEFAHEATGFSLIHHEQNYDSTPNTCLTCHAAPDFFASTTQTCIDCHNSHDSAFMTEHIQNYGTTCVGCHNGAGNMIDFDHARVFPLDGRHSTLACADCHVDQQFRSTPRECSACHREPEIHAGIFGLNCSACHSTTAWAPAQLIQHTFPLDHGGQGETACAICHTESYVTYTCFGCHEHNLANARDEHNELNLTADNLNDCAVCHATGQKQERDN